ncbi:MAG TPA: ferrochelatase [Coriobacteriia bacterium]
MQFGPWALVLFASIASGAVACGLMVGRRTSFPILWSAEAVALALIVLAAGQIWAFTHRPDLSIASVAIAVGACAGGYALAAGVLATAPQRRAHPIEWTFGPESPGTHVVVLSDEEPETYDPGAVTSALARYVEGDIRLPPEVGRPLIYASERGRYRRAGGSAARATVREIAETLQERLRSDGAARSVSAAFCEGGPTLPDVVSGIVAAGGRHVIIVALSAAWSRAFTEAFDELPLGRLAAGGVTVQRAQPLWPSSRLIAMLAGRTLEALGDRRDDAGVILLSEGDSWEHARSQEDYREQLIFFVQRVRAELVEAGVPAGRIRRASLWLGEPDVTEAARHLAAVGAHRIVLVPASFAAESIATQTDLPYAAERAQADTGTVVTTVRPWGNDPAVIEALSDAVRAAPTQETAPRL